ncbi:homeobox-leucine zipper protein HOX1-like [Argentina anserina]|uniref:homeobox-leucine zipper protein HOX1-like n=1 Tax=Argentina anserina TaxID=57926 RepID=UPI0021764D8D|nr:homeobox-leucine zipper protein HOX1-like [Potentilla anserina]
MGDYDPEACNTRLQLGLGSGGYAPRQEMRNKDRPLVCLDLLSIALLPKQEKIANVDHHMENGSSMTMNFIDEDDEDRSRTTDQAESEISNIKDGARKKLRLTKEQTTLLEDSFKRHSTLNPTQKHALAGLLHLKPRQVEVWFQNRRARTKLKQTEVDCEFLKKWCESLSNENRKLKKELQELKSLSVNGASSALLTHQIPKTTMLTMCSSCKKKAIADEQYPNNEAAAKAIKQMPEDLLRVVRNDRVQ